jgi:hypothetical protein
MALLVPNVGEVEMLSRLLNKNASDNVVLHLYKNDQTPGEADVIGDYTECTAAGYASQELTGSSWAVSTAGGVTTATYSQRTFTFTAAEPTVYGYYVTNNAGSLLLWAERFSDGPYAIPGGGGTIKITPKIELD